MLQIAIKNVAARGLLAWATAFFMAQPAAAALALDHWTLPSGARVWLAQSPAIPMLDVQIDFDAGSRRDPPAQAGLASVMASMTARGIRAADPAGAPSDYPGALDENQLSEAWADLGASFDASTDSDRLSFSLRSLTYPDLLARAVQLASRQLAAPAFPADIWQRDRERLVASIKEADTRPGTVAGKAFARAVYGDHPYGQQATQATLSRISVADMRALYQRHVVACRANVILVGAVTRAQAETLVNTLLARLPASTPGRCAPLPPVAEVVALAAPVEQRIPFDSAQAHVFIGQPGIQRTDPGYFPLIVGNYILGGGGFVSRLTSEVREKRGLSYSVYSYFAPARHAGAFTLGLQTRPDQADQAVQVARDVLSRFVADGPSEAELQAAKDNLVGGFALRIDSNRKLLGNIAGMAWNDLPLDYLDTWTQHVNEVTVDQIKAAFARVLQPQRMATVIVGARP
ncbi:MAG: insulinase family protein [Ramlibacter sp.]|nr:insulinase family protein [Ramlibacter sp.]